MGRREPGMKAKRGAIALAALGVFFFPALLLAAQEARQEAPPKPAQQKEKAAKPATDKATENAPDQPKWDPLRAEKDLEVGQYYMKRGDYDAAIDRFNDAIEAKPGFAIPFKYLGEAQEKRKLKKKALKSYQRYLDLVPHADDAEKIRKKIEKLQKEIDKESR